MAVYNQIGNSYDTTRCADPILVEKILFSLAINSDYRYLDLGCGSGNYTHALYERGLQIEGLDASEAMLDKAKAKHSQIKWHKGDARMLPFENNSFNGVTCIWATHHFQDLSTCFNEVHRVLNHGTFVMLTATPEQIEQYWLNEYFPIMLKNAAARQTSYAILEKKLQSTGFQSITEQRLFADNTLTDMFLQAGKHRPEIFLDEKYRASMSAFRLDCPQEELCAGLAKLQQDIKTGYINKIIKDYENELGDYSIITAVKEV